MKPIKKKQNKVETFVTIEKGSSHVCTDVISKPIKLETSATTQMADIFSKFNTMEFICLLKTKNGFIQGVFGRPEFNAASVIKRGETHLIVGIGTYLRN